MIERESPKGQQVKVCQYRGCGVPFARPANMKAANWEQSTRCPEHKKSSGTKKPAEPRLGHYEIKNKAIDHFLYATAPPHA